jgi:hypothetical protein
MPRTTGFSNIASKSEIKETFSFVQPHQQASFAPLSPQLPACRKRLTTIRLIVVFALHKKDLWAAPLAGAQAIR